MKRWRTAKTNPSDIITPAVLVEALERYGAEFHFTPAGSLIVRNLGKAPAELRAMLFACDGAQLVAFVRGRRRIGAESGQNSRFRAEG
jgi:hypothetical protein